MKKLILAILFLSFVAFGASDSTYTLDTTITYTVEVSKKVIKGTANLPAPLCLIASFQVVDTSIKSVPGAWRYYVGVDTGYIVKRTVKNGKTTKLEIKQ
jgi:hypothetical protein